MNKEAALFLVIGGLIAIGGIGIFLSTLPYFNESKLVLQDETCLDCRVVLMPDNTVKFERKIQPNTGWLLILIVTAIFMFPWVIICVGVE